MRIVNSLHLRVLLACIVWIGGNSILSAQGPCSAEIPLRPAPSGQIEKELLSLYYPQDMVATLNDLPIDWVPGAAYDLIIWVAETDYEGTDLSVDLSGASQLSSLYPAQKLPPGVFRLPFVYSPTQSLLHLTWHTHGQTQSPAGVVRIGFMAVQQRGCELAYGLGADVPDPSVWLMGEGPVYDDSISQALSHNQKIQNWMSLDPEARIARQDVSDFQPRFHRNASATLQGHPLIAFDGADDLLGMDYLRIAPQGDFTLLVVFRTQDEYGTLISEVNTPSYYAEFDQCQAGLRFGKFSHQLSSSGWDTYAQSYLPVNDQRPHIGLINVPLFGSRTIQVDGLVTGAHVINTHNDSLRYLLIGGHQRYSPFNGEIAEVLMFEPALSVTQLNQVQTYLAVKYGIPLQSDKCVGLTGESLGLQRSFRHNGGQLGVNLGQFVYQDWSESQGPDYSVKARLLEPGQHQYLFWGDNDSSLQLNTSFAPGTHNRIGKVWRFQEPMAPVGPIELTFSGLPAGLHSVLIHPADSLFSDDDALYFLPVDAQADGSYRLVADLPDGAYLTFSSDLSPLFWIELQGFSATLREGNAQLDWMSNRERFVESYTVERSVDGLFFSPIQTITATGNGQTGGVYHTLDPNLTFFAFGAVYYRLKVWARNGYFYTSSVVEVKPGRLPLLDMVGNYQPDMDQIHLRIYLRSNEVLSLRLLNLEGITILEKTLTIRSQIQEEQISTQGLAPGIYFVELYSENERSFTKILIPN